MVKGLIEREILGVRILERKRNRNKRLGISILEREREREIRG